MKTLHIIRHAKSSWEMPHLADIDRPLNKRGKRSCQFIASHIYQAGCHFNTVFCSPAIRAQQTISELSKALPELTIQWQIEQELYCFASEPLQHWIKKLPDPLAEIVIIGHNPALTDFCNALTGSDIVNIPTCGYLQLRSKTATHWRELTETGCDLAIFLQAKKLMG